MQLTSVPGIVVTIAFVLVYAIAWSAYLLCSSWKEYIVFPLAPYRCLLVVYAVGKYLLGCISLLPFAVSAMRTRPPGPTKVQYAFPFHSRTLDVYPAGSKAPVIVLAPSFMHPVFITGSKRSYTPIAHKLNTKGFCVVVPDIQYSAERRLKRAVVDLRLVLSWVGVNIGDYGGNADRIYVAGHGLSAHLALFTVVQEAVVLSRGLKGYDVGESRPPSAVSGGSSVDIEKIEIYAAQIRLPQLRGLVLLSGAYDVIKAYHTETERGIERLSLLRRMVGPSLNKFLIHSPSHLLSSSTDVLDRHFLPPRVLIVHGGRDEMCPIDQAKLLYSQLREAQVDSVEICAIRNAGHLETFTTLTSAPVTSFIM